MHWQIVLAIVVMIPLLILPVMSVWYLNSKGMRTSRHNREQR